MGYRGGVPAPPQPRPPPPRPDSVLLHRLPVDAAARHLGLSPQTVKRRLKRGTLRGEQEPTPTGFRWYVVVDTPGIPDTPADTPGDVPGTPAGVSAGTSGDTPDTPQTALQATRAQEMAEYTERLLAPWRAIVQQQAEEIGALSERTATLQARVEAQAPRITELEAPPTNGQAAGHGDAPAGGGGGAGRSWWRRLWG